MRLEKKEYLEAKKELFGEASTIEKVIRNYFDKSDLTKQLLRIQPLYYDENKIWWGWNKKKFRWEITDETNVLNFVNQLSFANTIQSKEKIEILESLKQESRLKKPQEIKTTWIQFKDTLIDIKTGERFKANPKYFVTNPIPWELHKEHFENTPVMDRIFGEWVGEKYIRTLYEIIAYCLLPSYPIHRIFCFIGGGMNGKTCFLNLLRKFVGKENICSTELDTLLKSRFEVTRLHKKLICQMGETNFNEINKTSILKKLSGGDLIGYEYKNKNPFEEINYAKILISTNNLPTTTDKTIGFYRRWMIIDFPNQFSEKKEILKDIPEEEYQSLALKSLGILKDLIIKREFHKEGSIEDRIKKYEDKSDPLAKFIKEFIIEEVEGIITKASFERKLNEWLRDNNHRHMSDIIISKRMKEKEIEGGKCYIDWNNDGFTTKKQVRAWLGISWKNDN